MNLTTITILMIFKMNDIINGSFELLSGIFCLINVVTLFRDKTISGVSWIPTLFFTLWGFWNLYYYPSLNQIFSFIGGIILVFVNLLWLTLVFYYKFNNKSK